MAARNNSARVTLTLSNIATTADLENLEERIMSALTEAIATLRQTVANLQNVSKPERVTELETALAEERRLAAELASRESAEDVEQDAALADARGQVDALLAEMTTAATELDTITQQLSAVGTAVDAAPEGTPVEEVEVPEVPAPDEAGAPPADAPVTEPAVETPAATGPVDADGNPVAAPSV